MHVQQSMWSTREKKETETAKHFFFIFKDSQATTKREFPMRKFPLGQVIIQNIKKYKSSHDFAFFFHFLGWELMIASHQKSGESFYEGAANDGFWCLFFHAVRVKDSALTKKILPPWPAEPMTGIYQLCFQAKATFTSESINNINLLAVSWNSGSHSEGPVA